MYEYGGEVVSTWGMKLKKSMCGYCLIPHKKTGKLIIDNSMMKYAQTQLSRVTQKTEKSVFTMATV